MENITIGILTLTCIILVVKIVAQNAHVIQADIKVAMSKAELQHINKRLKDSNVTRKQLSDDIKTALQNLEQ